MSGVVLQLVQSTRTSFRSGRTLSAEWRIGQLNAMLRMLDEQSEALAAALRQDLNKVSIIYISIQFILMSYIELSSVLIL